MSFRTQNLGRLAINWQGDYSASVTYQKLDMVRFDGNIYIYKNDLPSAGNAPTNTTYWAMMLPGAATDIIDSQFSHGVPSTEYIHSRGTGLVTNYTGLLGNDFNFNALTFDASQTPNLPGAFIHAGYGVDYIPVSDELITVDPNQVYQLSCFLRQDSVPGDWSAYTYEERHLQYIGVTEYDVDGLLIAPPNRTRYFHSGTDSLTTLTAPLTPGDTTITVADASGWNESLTASYARGVIIFEYKNSLGYKYDDYSRAYAFSLFQPSNVNKATNVITLDAGFPTALSNPDDVNGTWPVGTRIANSYSGSYKYTIGSGLITPTTDDWYKCTGYIGGIDRSGNSGGGYFNFAPGTAKIKLLWLANYSNRSGGYSTYPDTGSSAVVRMTGASITPYPMSQILENANGSIALKISRINSAGTAIEVITPAQTVEAVI